MDFFAATSDGAPAAPATAASPPVVDTGLGPTTTLPPTTSGVDAFAQAINARYSRAGGTSLIPLSPNQLGSTATVAAIQDAPPQPALPNPPLSFSLTMPTKVASTPAPALSLNPPPALFRSLSSAATTSPSSASSTMGSPAGNPASSSPTSSPASFTPLTPAMLAPCLSDPATLILDIRPHNAYALARLHSAVSLSVPSTLLKRPLFSLAKLAQMLSSPSARARFSTWPTASRIVIYDADSANLTEGGNVLGLLRKLQKEGFEGELCWVRGGFKGVWRERVDLVDQNAPTDEEEDEAYAQASTSSDSAQVPSLVPGIAMSKTTSTPATTTIFPGTLPSASGMLRTTKLPMSAFTSSSTTSQRSLRLGEPPRTTAKDVEDLPKLVATGMAINAVPSTPAPGRDDPFASPSVFGSTSSLPGSSAANSRSISSGQSFSLRLPPTLARNASAMPTVIPEGKTLVAFPPRLPNSLDFPNGKGLGGIELASSLPTQGAGAAYGMLPRERPHHKSFPGVGVSQSVPFNPFFDNIRQNLELAGRGSGEGIPLKLSRRVRRRVGELPFEWLREIARKSGKASDDILGADEKEDKSVMRIDDGSRTSKALDTGTSASEVSESEDEANGIHRSQRNRDIRYTTKQPGPLDPNVTSSSSTPSTEGEELAKELAMQFYKIELGEQKRLIGVMEHHSMESGVVVVDAPPNYRDSHRMPPLGNPPAFTTNGRGVPSGGLCGPLRPSSASVPGTSAATVAPTLTGNQNNVVGQAYMGTASARMLGGIGEGAVSVVPMMPATRADHPSVGVSPTEDANGRSTKQREKAFPFSITAGVEKGEKNRYRNIWPFEHARVRLRNPAPGADDYMNASYVQPLGTTKRYIATQGPLPATFADFWTLCWQENVHVIVMLTREVESAQVKCGNYWNEGQYGPLRLKLLSTTDTPERERRRRESEQSSGFFNIPQARALQKQVGITDDPQDQTIRRVFELTHSGYPHTPPRIITQLQYLEWPDLDVPKDPRGLLHLMQEVESVVETTREHGAKGWGEGPLRLQTSPTAKTPPGGESSESSDDENDGLDPKTGIARHAMKNTPVLLHCSAGVGRTGGFIAIDAILDGLRREMRKRREQRLSVSTGSPAPHSGSQSPVEPSSDAMDVDSRSTTSPSPAGGIDQQPTVSMSVAGNEVHVPVAGFTAQQEDMDVDPVENSGRAEATPELRRTGVFKASPALVEEVRRAHLARAALQQGEVHHSGRNSPRQARSEVTSSSVASSERRSTSVSAFSTESRTGPSSIPSSFSGSTTSLTTAIKTAGLVDGSKPSSSASKSTVQSATPTVADDNRAPAQNASTSEPSRLDLWRSEVRDTHHHHTTDSLPQLQTGKPDEEVLSPRSTTFDYASPRRIHGPTPPLLLSNYREPIRRVIEDMREQRMSLCQSLRQYVFVHRAIIEGALMIVDEEKKREEEDRFIAEKAREHRSDPNRELRSGEVPLLETVREHELLEGKSHTSSQDAIAALREGSLRHGEKPDVEMVEHILQPSPALPSPRSKRQASPTELVHEGPQGEVRLVKRPSVKRKHRSSDEEDGSLRFNSMVLTSPPQVGSERR